MDFVIGLLEDSGFNAILMVVDRLTKMRHLIPCRDTCTACDLAILYLTHVFRYHGLPLSIVSDRGPPSVTIFLRLNVTSGRSKYCSFVPGTPGAALP